MYYLLKLTLQLSLGEISEETYKTAKKRLEEKIQRLARTRVEQVVRDSDTI